MNLFRTLLASGGGDACNFETFQDVLGNEGGVVGVPKHREKVPLSERN
jgi:hypothetical protein